MSGTVDHHAPAGDSPDGADVPVGGSADDSVVTPTGGGAHGLDLRPGAVLWAVAALGTALRLAWVFVVGRLPTGWSDPFFYWASGISIARGDGYRTFLGGATAYYPPGYPFFLGGIYRITSGLGIDGWPLWPVGVAQSLLWGAAIVLIGLTGRVLVGRRAGVVAALIVACWPNLIAYAGSLMSESLFVAAFGAFVFGSTVVARTWQRGVVHGRTVWVSGVSAAVALAIATMVRPQVLLAVPAVALAWLLGGLGWRRVLVAALVAAVALAAFIVPWTIRNQSVFGHPVLISTNTGDNLCIGFEPDARGGFALPEGCRSGTNWGRGPAGEYEQDRFGRQRAAEFVVTDPLRLPALTVRKLFYTYVSDDDGLRATEAYGSDPVGAEWFRTGWKIVSNVFYAAVMVAALVGLAIATLRGWRRRDAALLATVTITLSGMLVPVLFFGDPRFKVATAPMFALLAALTWSRWFDREAQPAG